jgi:hypothetical protein
MDNASASVEAFFRLFELNNNKSDFSATTSQFADTFMAAGPQGTQCVKASDFAMALPKRKQLFDSYGCQSTSLIYFSETRLDDRYVMARTQWLMKFGGDQQDPKTAVANSTFIVDTSTEPFKIVFYFAHQDYMEVLKNHGILPA